MGKKLSTLETPHLINQLCPEAFLIRTFLGPIETCSFNSNSGQFLPMEAFLLSLSAIFALQLLRTICGRVCVYTGDKRYHLQSPHKSASVPRQRQQRSTASVQTQHSLSPASSVTQHQPNTDMDSSGQTVVTVGTRAVNKPSRCFTLPGPSPC